MDSPPLAHRLVEVIADLGGGVTNGQHRYGSGCVVRGRTVLTAAHVVAGAVNVLVRDVNKRLLPATVVDGCVGDVDGPRPDLALVEIDDASLDFPPLPLAMLNRDSQSIEPVDRCHALGYPWFAQTPSPNTVRDTVDAVGVIPVLSKLATGMLSLQVQIQPQELAGDGLPNRSAWMGISGGPVVAAGMLLGVVVEHAPREGQSTITATPLTALEGDPKHPHWGIGVANPTAWWSRLGVTSAQDLYLLPEPPPPRAQPAYMETLREYGETLHQRMPQLVGRERELEDISAFATGPPGYRWLVAGPYSGKTALLFKAVTQVLPDDADVVSYFLTRRRSDADSSRFLSAVVPQLAYLCEVDPPLGDPRDQFNQLWQQATARASERRRPLILVVDGLDEDLRPAGAPSVVSLLPARVVDMAHVLVASRPQRGPLVDVPPGHVLRSEGIQRLLQSFKGAEESAGLAEHEIYVLTHEGPYDLAIDVLGTLTAARGPLSVMDLAQLTSSSVSPPIAHVRHVHRLLTEDAVRSLERVGDAEDQRYEFAHDLIRKYAQQTPELATTEFLSRIHRWAETWRLSSWPHGDRTVRTPLYLFDTYPGRLSEDPARLAELVSDPGWVESAIRSVGIDRVVSDLRTASDAMATSRVRDTLTAVSGQAGHLRASKLLDEPGYVLRQLWLGAAEIPSAQLAADLRLRLKAQPVGSLVPEWTTRRIGQLHDLLGRHDGGVQALAVLPAGQIVSGGDDGRLLLWSTDRAGSEPIELGHHDKGVTAIGMLSGGQLVSAGADGLTLRDLDRPEAEPIVLDRCGWAAVGAMAMLPGGRLVAGRGGDMLVWELGRPDAEPTLLCSLHPWIRSLGVLPDGRVVGGSASEYGSPVLVWDLDRIGGDPLPLGYHEYGVGAVAVLPDGRVVSAGGDVDGQLLLCDPSAPGAPAVEFGRHRAWTLAVLPDGRVVSGGRDGRLLVWDPHQIGSGAIELGHHDTDVQALAVLPDGRVVSGGRDGLLLVWDPSRIDTLQVDISRHDHAVSALAVMSDGRLVTGDEDGRVLIWDPARIEVGPVELGRHTGPVWALAALPKGLVVSGGCNLDGRVLVWDPRTRRGRPPVRLGHHEEGVTGLVALPNGTVVSSGRDDRLLVAKSILGRWRSRLLDGKTMGDAQMAVLPDGRVVSSYWSKVLLWNPTELDAGWVELGDHGHSIRALAVLPSGRVVSGGYDGRVLLWQPDRVGVKPIELGLHDGAVRALAGLPGDRVISSGWDRVFIWSSTLGAPTVELNFSVDELAVLQQDRRDPQVIFAHEGYGMSCWTLPTVPS